MVAQAVLNLNRARSLLPSETECRYQSLYQYSGSKYLYIRKRPITGRHRNPMDTTLDCSSTDPRFEPASSQDFLSQILASPSIIVIFFYVFHISVLGNNTLLIITFKQARMQQNHTQQYTGPFSAQNPHMQRLRGSSPLPTPKFACTSISKLGFIAVQNQLRDEHIGGMQLN